MAQMNEVRKTKPAIYEAWQEGVISDEEAQGFFGAEWDDVQQLSRVEDILESQPEPEVDDSDLFY